MLPCTNGLPGGKWKRLGSYSACRYLCTPAAGLCTALLALLSTLVGARADDIKPPAQTSELVARSRWSLPVRGHGDAIAVSPAGDGPAPLIVILHGSWDRPEWICDMFVKVAPPHSWLLCLRGTLRAEKPPDGPRWTVGNTSETHTEINLAEDALRAIAPHRVGHGIALLVGFSKGASRARSLAKREPSRFPRLLLVEGGYAHKRSSNGAQATQRIAFGCGTQRCTRLATRACRAHTAQGGDCIIETDLRYKHSYNPPFTESGRRLVRWLFKDSRF